ncbi:hypothetical protein [Cryptosporangium phraense]|uniref:Uncharacterized protein n=1 Tax=Cryptosporangium phraense TaxID=2593070 RepID=A0A545AT92_9ACTN|nr:hypothetical protein [Cryptosporangium phraense]TQS44522.1 hypothetical protein FL583_13760 [Cryptosporangium phraense]
MDVIGAIVEDLEPYATARLSEQPGKILLDTLNGRPLQPPAVIVAPADAVANYVRSSAASARALWTDVGPEEGGLRLLLVHLNEEVLSKAQAGTTITVGDDEITVTGARGSDLADIDPDGEYYWTADRPDEF